MPKDRSLIHLLPLLLIGLHQSHSSSGARYPLCKPGLEFWSVERASCSPCTTCSPDFTLSPCAIHKDAICGPLSALELDWSFLSSRARPEKGQSSLEGVTSKMLWRFPELEGDGLREQTYDRRTQEERIVWDWQTGALVLAVCACILFFLVAGCSALVYARQWRRMKKNFEPGLEGISARLNIMVKAELAELVTGAPMSPVDPETRCQYLEKLLDRKRTCPVVVGWPEVTGNLYIEEGEPSKRKQSEIARIHRNIETILIQTRSGAE